MTALLPAARSVRDDLLPDGCLVTRDAAASGLRLGGYRDGNTRRRRVWQRSRLTRPATSKTI